MNLIFTAKSERVRLTQEFRNRSCAIAEIPLARLISAIKEDSADVVADAIVAFVEAEEPDTLYVDDVYNPDLIMATRVGSELRLLSDNSAMPDGRKWRSIPYLVLVHEPFLTNQIFTDAHKGTVLCYQSIDHAFGLIQAAVREYRQRFLNDLDNLGFLVNLDNGRYRVGPALKPRKELESEYYHSAADRREHGKNDLFTVDRELYGIQYEIEQFEALINKPDVSEGDLQKFFEDNPHFLLASQLMQAIPHARLEGEGGRLLIPDFILKPIVAMQRDSKWEVLDLKKPQMALLTGKRQRVQFSHQVMKAITQLRDYGEYFKDPRNSESVGRVLGHSLKYPKLAVLIGRLEKDIEALELAQARVPDVRIVTYDEILENQKRIYQLTARR